MKQSSIALATGMLDAPFTSSAPSATNHVALPFTPHSLSSVDSSTPVAAIAHSAEAIRSFAEVGDLRAQVTAVKTGERRFLELLDLFVDLGQLAINLGVLFVLRGFQDPDCDVMKAELGKGAALFEKDANVPRV